MQTSEDIEGTQVTCKLKVRQRGGTTAGSKSEARKRILGMAALARRRDDRAATRQRGAAIVPVVDSEDVALAVVHM